MQPYWRKCQTRRILVDNTPGQRLTVDTMRRSRMT
jgi:hypothetical protein